MSKHQYFVISKSLWQGDRWGAIAGPMSKAEAQQVAEEKADNGFNEYGLQNLKYVVETRVVSKSRMQRIYKIKLLDACEQIAYVEDSETYYANWQDPVELGS